MRTGICCLVILCSAAPAFAQGVPDPRRWDVTGSVGWLSGNKSELGEDWNDWYDTFAGSVDVGHYWTPHLKTELGVTTTTDGEVYSHAEVRVPTQPYPVFIPREHQFRLDTVNVGLVYQFLDNQWVHPFVNAGVQFGWEHERSSAPEYAFPGIDPRNPRIAPFLASEERSEFDARPFAGAGAKFYVNERGFVRTDFTLAWHRGAIGQVAWRVGLGIDF